jgi:hypothetical protein
MKIYFYLILIFSLIIAIDLKKDKKINNSNNTIGTNSKFAKIDLIIYKGIFYKKYKGELYYSKDCIKLSVDSLKEALVIGSNENYFWYTSTYDPIFYYGNIKDVNFILKEIFNPKNLIDILNPDEFIKKEIIIGNYGEELNRKIALKDKKVSSCQVYNNKSNIYTINYFDYKGNIPTKIKVRYIPEGTFIDILIKDISGLNDVDYSMPINNYDKKERLTP